MLVTAKVRQRIYRWESGYFDRALEAYGQTGRPCSRCGTPIRRVPFMNRSSFFCPRCQRPTQRQGRI